MISSSFCSAILMAGHKRKSAVSANCSGWRPLQGRKGRAPLDNFSPLIFTALRLPKSTRSSWNIKSRFIQFGFANLLPTFTSLCLSHFRQHDLGSIMPSSCCSRPHSSQSHYQNVKNKGHVICRWLQGVFRGGGVFYSSYVDLLSDLHQTFTEKLFILKWNMGQQGWHRGFKVLITSEANKKNRALCKRLMSSHIMLQPCPLDTFCALLLLPAATSACPGSNVLSAVLR